MVGVLVGGTGVAVGVGVGGTGVTVGVGVGGTGVSVGVLVGGTGVTVGVGVEDSLNAKESTYTEFLLSVVSLHSMSKSAYTAPTGAVCRVYDLLSQPSKAALLQSCPPEEEIRASLLFLHSTLKRNCVSVMTPAVCAT